MVKAGRIKQESVWDMPTDALCSGNEKLLSFSEVFSELVGADGEGVYSGTMHVLDLEDPTDKAWNDEFVSCSGGLAQTVIGICSYDATNMLAAAMKKAAEQGEVNRKTLRDELAALDGFVGMSGPIKFNPIGDVTRKYRVSQIVNGKWVAQTDYDYYQ